MAVKLNYLEDPQDNLMQKKIKKISMVVSLLFLIIYNYQVSKINDFI